MANTGQAISGVVGAVVGFAYGGPVGALYGLGMGLTVGGVLFPPDVDSPKMTPGSLQIQSSQYGMVVPVAYGANKVAGNLIWYGNFQTHEHTESAGGGKGGGGAESTSYTYSVGLAFGLSMTSSTRRISIRKAWAGKTEISLDKLTIYDGSQTEPDSYLAGFVPRQPVYKNLCYVVLRDYDLGNSTYIPNFTFELVALVAQPSYVLDSFYPSVGVINRIIIQPDGKIILGGTYTLKRFNSDGSLDASFNTTNTSVGIISDMVLQSDGKLIVVSPATAIWNRTYIARLNSNGSLDSDFNPHKWFGLDAVGLRDDDKIIYADYEESQHRIKGLNKDGTVYFSTTMNSGSIYSIATQPDNKTIIGGYRFSVVGGLTRNRIARLNANGSVDSEFNPNADGTVNIIKVLPDGKILVSGAFTQIGGISRNRIARLNPDGTGDTSFNANNTPLSTIYAINVQPDGKILIGQAIEPSCLIRLNTDGSLDASFNITILYATGYAVRDIELQHNVLIVAGKFVIVNGVTRNNIARLYRPLSLEANDESPAVISKDILTNDLYGMGLEGSYLNLTEFSNTDTYCNSNSLLVSLCFNSQISILDALQHIISHHNGYISYYNGQIAHKQLKAETPISGIASTDIVQADNEFPINISKKGGRDYNNKIVVEYTKRDNDYVIGTATVDDMVDIDDYGLKDATVKLNGITLYPMASKMANMLLKKSLSNPESMAFKLGPKAIGIKPGNVYTITDSSLELSSLPIRIETISEGDDHCIEVTATEEINVYSLIVSGEDSTVPPSPPEIMGDPGDVVNPMSIELPAVYSSDLCRVAVVYSGQDNEAWAGASIYRGYTSDGTYLRISSAQGKAITGKVLNVGGVDDKYITVLLDWDATLSSAIDFNDLITTPLKNMLFVRTLFGDKFIKYQTAELTGVKTWKLSGLIYDLAGVPYLNTYGDISADDKIGFYANIPNVLTLTNQDKFRNIFLKPASFNFGGLEQSLADVDFIEQEVKALCDTPLIPYNIKINDIAVDDSAIVASGDINLKWQSRNRYNSGAMNFTRTDTVRDDLDLITFEIGIYNSGTLLRTVDQTSKEFIYTEAMQTTDGGFSNYDLKISQINTLAASEIKTLNLTII